MRWRRPQNGANLAPNSVGTRTNPRNLPISAMEPPSTERHYHGTSRRYILARLRQEGLGALAEAVTERRVSAYAIAAELGWVRRSERTVGSPNAEKRRRLQIAVLKSEGLFGPVPEEDERATWLRVRDEAMRWFAHSGRRPPGWWTYEAPALGLAWPGYEQQAVVLYEAGVLEGAELAELLQFWREEFDRCHASDFTVTRPWPEPMLTGKRARAAHLAWANIPPSLLEQFRAERRRRHQRNQQEGPAGSD
jgi:hypothetical protein